jgi:phage FluMu protein Com
MSEPSYDKIVEMLIAYWQGSEPAEKEARDRCRLLADIVVRHLPAQLLERIRSAPRSFESEIQATLTHLVQADPMAERLVRNLSKARRRTSGDTTATGNNSLIFISGGGISFSGSSRPLSPDPPPSQTGEGKKPQVSRVNFMLEVAPLGDLELEVRADTPMGQYKGKGWLPFNSGDGLAAIHKVLLSDTYHPAGFSEAQNRVLQELSLLHESRFAANKFSRIGQGLYQALFPGEVSSAFKMALTQVRMQRSAVHLQLRLDSDAVDLASYPWELLHDGHRSLLSSGAVELTRYIVYSEAPTSLGATPPWRLLYIAARPRKLSALPGDIERQAVWNGLQPLALRDRLTLEKLVPPTYDALLDALSHAEYHILHFDGHGVFGRRCPICKTINQSHLLRCVHCAERLADIQPNGFLAFEEEDGQVDYVDTGTLENALLGSQARLAVLSACFSSTVRGETIFGGIAPGLIRAGIPAVVAMQLPIYVNSAIGFAKAFYTSLAQGDSIPSAVAQGRRRLYRDQSYFIPTLYLRSSDDEGRLFVSP